MARERIVKDTPKRGRFTKSQVRRAVQKVIYTRLGLEVPEPSTKPIRGMTTIKVWRDVETGRFMSREEAERRTDAAMVETIKMPKKKR